MAYSIVVAEQGLSGNLGGRSCPAPQEHAFLVVTDIVHRILDTMAFLSRHVVAASVLLAFTFLFSFRAQAASRFHSYFGLSVSEYRYSERVRDLHLTETALTGTAGAQYYLVRRYIDSRVSGHATLASLLHSPSSMVAARFYGFDAALGVHLPLGRDLDGVVSPGAYFWMMRTGSSMHDQYGISSMVSGPQICIAVERVASAQKRWFSVYAKYALISDGGFAKAVSTSSGNELAGGLAVAIKKSERPWSTTLDFARIRVESKNNAMRLLTVTAGIQKTF